MVANDYTLDDKTVDFLLQTYKILTNEDINASETYSTNFGPTSSYSYIAPIDSLIIGFRYDEFDYNGMSDDEWDENNDKQVLLLQKLNKKIKDELEKKLLQNVCIIQYNEYSVKPLNNCQIKKRIGM